MAGFFENLLKDATSAFFGNEYLRDFDHASKTFRTNGYAYSPKFKFLFHVYFDINESLLPLTSLITPKDANFGLAVKSVQLPKFSVDTHDLNQYNRKRIVQTKIKYDPIMIKFHDDNNNLVKNLWYSYFKYYYKDTSQMGDVVATTNKLETPTSLSDLNKRNIYDPSIEQNDDWGYIGENVPQSASASALGHTKTPFFRAINVYGFNQHNFVLYRLINPMIESFQHDTYDYSMNNVMENTMTVKYETVKYYEGALDGRSPEAMVQGFGTNEHYDKTLSPIARPGSQSTILGQGGLVSAAGGIMEDISQGNILGAVQKAGAAANTFKNPQNILKIAKSEALQTATNSVLNTPNRNNSFNFPAADSTVIRKIATPYDSNNSVKTNPQTPPQ